jgi:hypothetical protein
MPQSAKRSIWKHPFFDNNKKANSRGIRSSQVVANCSLENTMQRSDKSFFLPSPLPFYPILISQAP